MIVLRMLLIGVLVSSSTAVSMEKEFRPMDIQDVLNAIVKPYKEGQLNDIQLVTLYHAGGGNINAKGIVSAFSDGKKIGQMNLLMTSVVYDRPKLMKFLINKCYIRLDCVNEHGDTALHIAAATSRAGMAKILLASGANKNIQNNNGKTPLDEAYDFPWRNYAFYNNKSEGSQNHHFPTLIKLLERPDKKKTQNSQLFITQ